MKQDTKTYENEKIVRVVTKDNGEIRFCLSDLAKCAGYKAPDKFCARCEIKGERLTVSWKRKTKGTGRAQMLCVSAEEYFAIAKKYSFPDQLTSWITEISKLDQPVQPREATRSDVIYEIANDDIETDLDMMLEMLNNLTYACLELRREIERAKKKVVYVHK